MDRKNFLFFSFALIGFGKKTEMQKGISREAYFFSDDGVVPNSKYPLLLYRNVFSERGDKGAVWLEEKFLSNNWSNSWRNGVFTFQHYHSIAHEVLGFYSGEVNVLLGGDKGKPVLVKAGDIVVIPAGVGHKNLGDKDLGVVGAYPNGMAVDIMRCLPGERPGVDNNIAAVPFPGTDPLLGKEGGLLEAWKI